MYVKVKNSYLVAFLAILAIVFGNNDAIAAPRTWVKDENGRVLVYRAEPSKLAAAALTVGTATGFGIISLGFLAGITLRMDEGLAVMIPCSMLGSLISLPCAYFLKQLFDEYNSLYKPLIIIDKYGITYEGHAKILWKNVCAYRPVEKIIYTDGHTFYNYYLEISTDIDRLQIYEHKIAITWQMLYKLIDEAYKIYKEGLEK